MHFHPVAHDLATRLVAAQVHSARPDAPTILEGDHDAGTHQTLVRTRTTLARALRAVAGWLEPAPRPSAQGMIGACARQ